MRRFLYLLILLLIVGCGRALDRLGQEAAQETDQSNGQELGQEPDQAAGENGDAPEEQAAQPSAGNTTILADGWLVAKNPALPLTFQSSGKITAILVQAGDEVSAGDLIATLDDGILMDNVGSAELAVAQAEISLDQAQLALDRLVDWKPDELAVSAAESNLTAAEANLESALAQEEVAGSSLTSANVSVAQAQRALADIQEAYDNAWDEARDWELNYTERICYPGQGGPVPCSGPTWQERIKNERNSTERGLQGAKESLSVAWANYNLTQAGLGTGSTLNAEASIAGAQQALDQAKTGPTESDIGAARLQVAQAELALEQSEFNLELSQQAVDNAMLYAPWGGTILSVDSAVGALAGGGMPIVTLMDVTELQFHTSNLSERDLAYIGPGQAAEIVLKSYPTEEISGIVAYVVPQASGVVGDAATFTVVIDLEQTEQELKPGMSGRVNVERVEE